METGTKLYENGRYSVVFEGHSEDKNYAVVNKENDCKEAFSPSLPQALVYADQFDVIIDKELHKIWAGQLYNPMDNIHGIMPDFPAPQGTQ